MRLMGLCMRRDMDLVRDILIKTADAEGSISIEAFVDEDHSMDLVAYHVEMMAAHDLIDAKVQREWGGHAVQGVITALTWDGQDYLDAIENDAVWEKTKETVKGTVKHTTLSVIRDVAVAIAKSMIMAQTGLPIS